MEQPLGLQDIACRSETADPRNVPGRRAFRGRASGGAKVASTVLGPRQLPGRFAVDNPATLDYRGRVAGALGPDARRGDEWNLTESVFEEP